jgi:hypothetical protein
MAPTLTEALRELLATAHRACAESPDARVVGERVKVRAVELRDGPAPALIAEVVRRGVAHHVSLADLQAEAGSALAEVVARYRKVCGWSESASPSRGSSPAPHPIEAGGAAEVAILSVKPTAARCRAVGSTATFTLRTTGLHRLIPGEIARTRIRKSWRNAGHPYASGEVERTTLDVARLGLVPLRLEPHGDWDPEEEYWGEEGEPLASWAKAIVARGVRPAFEMEQVIPDADPEDWESDPIIDAAELNDLSALAEALDDHAPGHDWYLDLVTGDVLPVFEDFEDELLPVPREELEESPRFLNIPPRPSRDGWRDMADFVATVDDRALRQRLADAIEGKGAFGRFKQVLQSAPAERDRWFELEGERLEEEARAWLASEGIEAVPRAKA